jgi:uncharacterized protein
MPVVVLPIVVAGAVALLWIGRRLRGRQGATGGGYVAWSLRYQPLALVIALGAVLVTRLAVPDHADYLAVGDWSAPASGLGWLGVADGDSWTSVGLTFLVIMTFVTAVVVWLQVGRGRGLGWRPIAVALPWAVAFSVVNALSEELLFRVTVAEALAPTAAAWVVAAVSAVLFGLPHWFGTPGRLPGVLLAGFMGWFLTLAVVQTGGIGWAWLIHSVQDVVIITLLIAVDARAER